MFPRPSPESRRWSATRTAALGLALASTAITMLIPTAPAARAAGTEVRLGLIAEDATKVLGGYMPQRLELRLQAPESLRQAPANLTTNHALYGSLEFGPAEARARVLVVLEEPAGGPRRCWIDANANGDLTDDPPVRWESKSYNSRDGKERTMCSGSARLTARQAGEELQALVRFYRFDPADTDREQLKFVALYYADYARRGTLDLGGRAVPALLCDDRATGDFRGVIGGEESGVRLALDLDGDGTFDRRPWESFDVRKPFNVGGTTWELAGLTWSGASFTVAKSDKTVAEVKIPPALKVGETFPPFEAKTLGGHEVKFPGSFAGKLVVLDFWATWCGPCRAELPNLKANYAEFRPQGVEVLGISLDNDNARERVQEFLKTNGIEWDQVYEGGGWKTRLGRQYNIDSIPRVFLIDGDTGRIVATTGELRGPALAGTLKQALAKRTPAGK